MEPYDWGPASVTYGDWHGTFQIDQKQTGTTNMYTLTGVDREQWVIIGLDWGGGETGWHDLHVVVVPKGTDLDSDAIHATDLLIHDMSPADFLLKVMHLADFRARLRRLSDAQITITALGDVGGSAD